MNFSIVVLIVCAATAVVLQSVVDTRAARHDVRGVNWRPYSPPYWNPRYVTGRTRGIVRIRSGRDVSDHVADVDDRRHAGHHIAHDSLDCEVGHRRTHSRDPGTYNRIHGAQVDQKVPRPDGLTDATQLVVTAVNETATLF